MFIIIVNRVSAVVIFTSKHNMLIKKLGIQSCLDTYNALCRQVQVIEFTTSCIYSISKTL